MKKMSNDIEKIECRFAIHIPSSNSNRDIPDIHLIKEQIHYSNGEIKPNIRFIKNFKRPFWISKKNKRNYTQKKEWEHTDNLLKIEVTQSEMRNSIAKVLDRSWSNDSIKQLSTSPYLYGSDISSTSILKQTYIDKYPNTLTPFTIATFDIETDVLFGTGDIIMATIIFKDKIFTSILSRFVIGLSNINDRILKAADKYIGSYLEKHNMKIEINIADTVPDLLRSVFSKAHEWKPDFLSIWNMDFDIPQVLNALEKYNVDPKDILCDPSVPKNLRICKYKQGIKKKVTSSGVVKPINPSAQWHTLHCTSSFYVIDAMCVYKQIRLAKQEEPSYSLDSILNKELGIRKLKFKEADEYQGIRWHQFMQSEYKVEYIVYNMFDCLSMIELDKSIKDLSFTVPSFAGISDFSNFKSQPKKISDALHYFCLSKDHVIGSTGYTSNDDEDEDETLGLAGWIVTLPAHLSVLGLNCIEEDSSIKTNVRAFVFDSDSTSAYPTCTSTANVSKETTKRELIDISGVNNDVFRMQNMNLIMGSVNAIEYSVNMFNMPKPNELLTLINK